jgi:O-antigen ligase
MERVQEAQEQAGVLGQPGTVRRGRGKGWSYPLLLFAAVVAPWGSGLGDFLGLGLSKLFVAAALGLVGYWVLFAKKRFCAFSKNLNALLLFVVAHTLVFYLVFHPEMLVFGYGDIIERPGGGTTLEEGLGLSILRVFLFAGFGYACGRYLYSRRRLTAFATAYGLGFVAMMFVSSGARIVNPFGEARAVGSFANPNAFALSCATALFLTLFALQAERTISRRKVWLVLVLLVAAYGLVSSGSRAGLAGTAVGSAFMFGHMLARGHSVIRFLVLSLAVGLSLTVLLSEQTRTSLVGRVSVEQIRADRGAARLAIWAAYLSSPDRYIVHGVGLQNAPTVVTNTFGNRLRAPHNLFLKMTVEFGLVGLFLFLLAAWELVRRVAGVCSAAREKAAVLGLVVCWLVIVLFHDAMGSRDTWLVIAFASAFARVYNRKLICAVS